MEINSYESNPSSQFYMLVEKILDKYPNDLNAPPSQE